jgi:hypothetical protein
MIKEHLRQILNSEGSERNKLIHEFQQTVWGDMNLSPNVRDILSTLAYDLDFYESDARMRSEDSSYYGDVTLHEEIITVLKKLEAYVDI